MGYDYDSYYTGLVKEQGADTTKDGDLQIVFTVELESRLLDNYNPDGGTAPAPKATVRTSLKFGDANLEITQKDLERLGFDPDRDPNELIPGESNHFSLVGQKVYLQPKLSSYNGRNTVWWNLRFPSRRTPKIDSDKKDSVTKQAREKWRAARQRQQEAAAKEAEHQGDVPF